VLRCLVLLLVGLVSLFCRADEPYPFSIESVREAEGHRLVANNHGPAPVSVKLVLIDASNVRADRTFPLFMVVPAESGSRVLAHIRPAAQDAGYAFRTRASWLPGDFDAVQDPAALYRLPYPEGKTFRLSQAPDGPLTTHTTPDSHYAVDIPMPEGTPVLAAREGVVFQTETGQIAGGKDPELISKANDVRILHPDGTIGLYAHLAYGGVQVSPGQHVVAGEVIGLSGSTGYSSGPHLHFAVLQVAQQGADQKILSVPFQFYLGQPPTRFAPKTGMVLTANYTGQVPLAEVESGRMGEHTAQTPGQDGPRTSLSTASLWTLLAQLPPVWGWMGGLLAVLVLLLVLKWFRDARREQAWRRAAREDPFFWSRQDGED